MNVLFEEGGSFKIGTLLADNDSTLQVESQSGKRSKIKSATVLMRFADAGGDGLLTAAEPMASEIAPDFLWECVDEGEFSFLDCARDYFGHTPTTPEALAILLALQAAPVYFHRRGKGCFRRAPPDILQAALAGQEKKRQQAEMAARLVESLKAFNLPDELRPLVHELLYKPDRNKPETKAFEAACSETGLSAAHLLFRCGALRSPYEVHYGRFMHDYFPRGTAFPALASPLPALPSLPLAEAAAFSIDDASTTEIDDAFTVQSLPGVGWRIGIHIAAPGLGVLPGSELDGIARSRLSTVYMPGAKITMLPEAVVGAFTLAEGKMMPAVSLYLTVSPELEIVSTASCLEQVRIAANIRQHELEPLFNETTLTGSLSDFPFSAELKLLWQFACANEQRRGKAQAHQFTDYNFDIEGNVDDLDKIESCRVIISERKRGSPMDKLVSELAIIANSTWGALLAEHKVPAIYRAQTSGKVRMTTSPLPHEGLGVSCYAWASSPLRRYADLLNQWQLIAVIGEKPAPFAARSDMLFAAMRDFELTYAAYAEFQRGLERYWCLRWLRQENVTQIDATVRRETLVKLDHLPLFERVPSLPSLQPGQRVRLSVDGMDELTLALSCRYLETLEGIDTEADTMDDPDESGETDENTAGEMETMEMTEPAETAEAAVKTEEESTS